MSVKSKGYFAFYSLVFSKIKKNIDGCQDKPYDAVG